MPSNKYECQCGYPARSADDLFDHMVNADDGQQHGSK
ncbi:hypothetical protein K378_01430 [Streptomyces sp. Amel2xB2]|nr:hypothetical protein K378_01430 [Streptomyces sp. Amel2xB2]